MMLSRFAVFWYEQQRIANSSSSVEQVSGLGMLRLREMRLFQNLTEKV